MHHRPALFNVLSMLVGLLAPIGNAGAATAVDPSDAGILYTGRWEASNPSQPWCYWIGSSIQARFEGTSLTGTFSAGNTDYLRIILDGDHVNSTKIPVGSGAAVYTLASGLPDGVHTIEIVKETDVGSWTVYGFALDEGKSLVAPPARPPRRIQFYGDSNLAGYSLESEQNQSGVQLRGSHFGYAGIASRMLDAEYQNVSRSGATISSLNNAYDRFSYGSPNPVWNFADFAADVVVVNIGANDVGGPKHIIKNRYHALLDDLRASHPASHIVLYNAWGWDYDETANYTHEVVAERSDPDLSYAVFPWLFEQWHGCEYDHGGMAHVLAGHLEAIMGWTPGPADVMSGYGEGGDVANGSFEAVAPFGGYGWRYFTDAGVSRVHDPTEAFSGEHYLRLSSGASSHQPIPAGDGETVTVTAWARGAGNGDELDITLDFRDQEMYTSPLQTTTETRDLTTDWQLVTMTATAPTGTSSPVYHTRITFTAGSGDNVDIDLVTLGTPAGADEPGIAGRVPYRLGAHPSPFRLETRIAFELTQPSRVLLSVFDSAGRRVGILADTRYAAGSHAIDWDGRKPGGGRVGPGIYFVRAVTEAWEATRKVVLLP